MGGGHFGARHCSGARAEFLRRSAGRHRATPRRPGARLSGFHRERRRRIPRAAPRHQGGRVMITTANGVDKALDAVSRELDQLPGGQIKYLEPSAGTYNCRAIAGSTARSMHAYAAAIDVNTAFSDYWRWAPHPAEP